MKASDYLRRAIGLIDGDRAATYGPMKALHDKQAEALQFYLAIRRDPAAPAKVLIEMGKVYKELELKIGQISGRPITPDAIKRLADLPGRDQLLALVLSAMQAVPTALARVLNGTITNLLNVLKAIETDKDNGEKAEETPLVGY